ncbi:transcription termination factor 1-like [Neodiprion pinetum]|uniref:transcription termination factor 1-like n=1 Tax=Neodiprion pinetum TaxID=441929 RepID=UPI001EDE03B0|nr:uncharacterized protein LOC124212056 [Neodiprion pinetum]XP_046467726.1 uncharacterized protein LOC124212056 [Neodiprion pinetum]
MQKYGNKSSAENSEGDCVQLSKSPGAFKKNKRPSRRKRRKAQVLAEARQSPTEVSESEPSTKNFLFSLHKKDSEDKITKKHKKSKKSKQKVETDDRSGFKQSAEIIENKNPNHQSSAESSHIGLEKATIKKSNSKTKHKIGPNITLTDFFTPKVRKCVKDVENSDDMKYESKSNRKRRKSEHAILSDNSTINPVMSCDSSNISVKKSKLDTGDLKPKILVSKEEVASKINYDAEEKCHNTLLAMIHGDASSSDSDDETKTTNDGREKPPREESLRKTRKTTVSEIFTTSDDEKDIESSDQESIKISRHRNFELAEEAKDVEEMISALEEEEQLPRETVKKLRNLCVKLKHTVPPQHMIESCAGSRGPTKIQREAIEKLGPIKYGKFTPEEDDIIVANWKSFCKTHNWDSRNVKPFMYMRHHQIGTVAKFEERQKFVQYLAAGLPWRTLYSVYWRFRNLYQPHVQSRYTDKEDKLIIAHMENDSAIHSKNIRKFSELGKILNRTRASVWRRYRLLKKKKKPKSIEWDSYLLKKFIRNLMLITLSDDIRQLKDLSIPLVVWKKLSKKLKINEKDLKYFWLVKLHMQLFCKERVYLNDVKIKIIEYIYAMGISEWWELEWSGISKKFDGMTSTFLSTIFNSMVHDEIFQGKQLSEIVEYLYHVKKPQLQEATMDRCLPRIVFTKHTVKLLDTELDDQLKLKKLLMESSVENSADFDNTEITNVSDKTSESDDLNSE